MRFDFPQKKISNWRPEKLEFWQTSGAKIANRNLWSSIPCLSCAFAAWLYWSILTVQILFLILFVATGIGSGSTFRMIPIIFETDRAGLLSWTSAVAAYGAFIISKVFGDRINSAHPEYVLYGFAIYYLICLIINWWFYARKDAEIPC